MAQIKHVMDDRTFEINTDLGDAITVTITCARTNELLAEYTKSMAEEVVNLLESKYAQMSIVDVICLSADKKNYSEEELPIQFSEKMSSKGLNGYYPFSEN